MVSNDIRRAEEAVMSAVERLSKHQLHAPTTHPVLYADFYAVKHAFSALSTLRASHEKCGKCSSAQEYLGERDHRAEVEREHELYLTAHRENMKAATRIMELSAQVEALKKERDELVNSYEDQISSRIRQVEDAIRAQTAAESESTRLKAELGKRMESEGLLRLAFNEKNHEVNVLREREKVLVEALEKIAGMPQACDCDCLLGAVKVAQESIPLAALSAEPEGKEKK